MGIKLFLVRKMLLVGFHLAIAIFILFTSKATPSFCSTQDIFESLSESLPFSNLFTVIEDSVCGEAFVDKPLFLRHASHVARALSDFAAFLRQAFTNYDSPYPPVFYYDKIPKIKALELNRKNQFEYFTLQGALLGCVHHMKLRSGKSWLTVKPYRMPFNGRLLGQLSARILPPNYDYDVVVFLKCPSRELLPTNYMIKDNLLDFCIEKNDLSLEVLHSRFSKVGLLEDLSYKEIILENLLCAYLCQEYLKNSAETIINNQILNQKCLIAYPEKSQRMCVDQSDLQRRRKVVVTYLAKAGTLLRPSEPFLGCIPYFKSEEYPYWDMETSFLSENCYCFVLWSKYDDEAKHNRHFCSPFLYDVEENQPLLLVYNLSSVGLDNMDAFINSLKKLVANGIEMDLRTSLQSALSDSERILQSYFLTELKKRCSVMELITKHVMDNQKFTI